MVFKEKILNTVFIVTGLLVMLVLFCLPGFSDNISPLPALNTSQNLVAFVYPNPVTNAHQSVLYVEFKGSKKPLQTKIFDVAGKLLYETTVNKHHRISEIQPNTAVFEVPLKAKKWRPGVYYVSLSNGEIQRRFPFTVLK